MDLISRSRSTPQDLNGFVDEQKAILNGIHENLSKSPVSDLEVGDRDVTANAIVCSALVAFRNKTVTMLC
jgi:hypothetical protein